MSKRVKLFWASFWVIFVISFTITSLSLLFYALGLNFNYKTGKITQTSILMVSSVPSRAEVFFDNKQSPTPAKFNRILPGRYHLAVSLPDFQSWEKDIELLPGEVLRLNDALLIYKEPKIIDSTNQNPISLTYLDPQKFELADVEQVSLSPDGNFLAYKKSNEVWLKDLNNDEYQLVTRFSRTDFSSLQWHADSSHLFVLYQGKIQILDLDGANLREVAISPQD